MTHATATATKCKRVYFFLLQVILPVLKTGERDNFWIRLRYRYQPFCTCWSSLLWMRKEVVWEEVCKATTFLCSIAQKLPSFFFFFLIALDWVYGGLDLEVTGRKSMGNEMELGSVGQMEPWQNGLRSFVTLLFLRCFWKKLSPDLPCDPDDVIHTHQTHPPCVPVYFFIPTFFCIYIFVFIYSSNGP